MTVNMMEFTFGAEKSIANQLTEAGFDVWLANYRGTRWSSRHVNPEMTRFKMAFWQFEWEDLGTKDLPKFIDFILARTGR
jgi:lysosomal acid lipase/cholesteryl ester hydrolase